MFSRLALYAALLGAAVAVSACGSQATIQQQGEDSSTWQALSMDAPSWQSQAKLLGPLDPSRTLSIQVHLRMRNQTGAEAELAAISNPKSSKYHQFLSPQQFAASYGPATGDVEALVAHLSNHGLRVTYVPNNFAFVQATGTVKQVEQAFAVQLQNYQVGSETRWAPSSTPRLPMMVAPKVLAALGLATPTKMGSHAVRVGGIRGDSLVHPADGTEMMPCSEWYGQSPDLTDPAYFNYPSPLALVPCSYRPAQLRNAYGFAESIRQGNDGTSITVGIVDAYMSPTLLQDAQIYAANNDPDYPLASSQFSAVMAPGTATPVDTGWYQEQSLDVEAVHAMAPGANIAFVGAQSSYFTDLVAAINYIVDNQLADIISNSYGTAESQPIDFVIVHSAATEAGLKGVGLYFSTGDNGDESQNLGYPSPDFPASMDNVTAVGGTSMALGQTGTVLWQVGWETGASWLLPVPDAGTDPDAGATDPDAGTPMSWQPAAPGTFIAGAGGGASYIYEQPAWQQNVVPAAMANVPGAPARVIPDVAMLADPWTGFWVGQTDPTSMQYGEYDIGGTSLACPLFAAVMALAEQNAGHGFGFAAPALYAQQSTAFIDVVPNPVPQAIIFPSPGAVVVTYDAETQSLVTAPGFDTITGLGVPAGSAFLSNMQ